MNVAAIEGFAGTGRASVIETRQCSNLTSIPRRRPFRSGDAATRRRAERRDAMRVRRKLYCPPVCIPLVVKVVVRFRARRGAA